MKKLLIFGIILILLLPVLTMADKTSEEIEVLKRLLEDLQAQHHESDIVTNGVLMKKFVEEEAISEIGEDILKKMELVGYEADPLIEGNEDLGEVYHKQIIFEDDYSQINYVGYDKDKNLISIYLSSYLNNDNLKGETYLCINIVKKDDFLNINGIMNKVESIYKEYDSVMDTTSCLIGTIEGKYSREGLGREVNKAIRKIKGQIISEFEDDKILSYTIYTPNIEKNLTMDKKKINLNLAIRYNEYEDRTYLWIGTPIITIGY